MANFYVTYGSGTKQGGNYSLVERDSYDEAREYVFRVIGGAFAFMYDEDQWKKGKQTIAQRYGLSEIPLQAHEKY
jgi:hypothetical protein